MLPRRDFGHFDGHRRPESAAWSAKATTTHAAGAAHAAAPASALATRSSLGLARGSGELLSLHEPEVRRRAGDGHHESDNQKFTHKFDN